MTQSKTKLNVSERKQRGKGAARRLRRRGQIPGVLYGQGKGNVPLAVDPRVLRQAMDPQRRYNTMFTLILDDGEEQPTVIADYDMDRLKDTLLHVDFLRVDPEAEVVRDIPVAYKGRAAGVVAGGRLKTLRRKVRVRCPANAVPVQLMVDVSPLKMGQTLRIRDVTIDDAELLERPDTGLAFVQGAAKVKAEEEAAEPAPAPAS